MRGDTRIGDQRGSDFWELRWSQYARGVQLDRAKGDSGSGLRSR